MKFTNRRRSLLDSLRFAGVVLCLYTTIAFASGPVEKVIYTFSGSPGGAGPVGGLIADSSGNLYGTALHGGGNAACDCGIVFELSPPSTGSSAWTETVLYSFQGGTNDGYYPSGTLVMDSVGNLYGTTENGGPVTEYCAFGCGSIFELSPPPTPHGTWKETILSFFTPDCNQGCWPNGSLIFDGVGNLYGVTPDTEGVVFELSPPLSGETTWTRTTLHLFHKNEGFNPLSLVMRRGNLYGTTGGGYPDNAGAVFQLVHTNTGWTAHILYKFPILLASGSEPVGRLIFDRDGNIYGTTYFGGIGATNAQTGFGVVYELSPATTPGDPWVETTLYSFTGGKDGANPYGGLHFDRSGNLYGTASTGGLRNKQTRQNGTIFELSPPAVTGADWTETTLHDFGGSAYSDGSEPTHELLQVGGKLYGTTFQGGSSNLGTVFSLVITP